MKIVSTEFLFMSLLTFPWLGLVLAVTEKKPIGSENSQKLGFLSEIRQNSKIEFEASKKSNFQNG